VAVMEDEGPEPARIPTSLTATLREQGGRYPHRVSRRTRRKGRAIAAPRGWAACSAGRTASAGGGRERAHRTASGSASRGPAGKQAGHSRGQDPAAFH